MRLFNIMSTAYDNFDTTVRSYLSKTLSSLGYDYTHNQIFGVIFDGIKGIMQNAMFYIEDAFTEQNVYTASRKKSVYSLAKLSGYDPYYGSAATGTLLAKVSANNTLTSSTSTKLFLNNYTTITNKSTGINYVVILPTSRYVFDLSAPLVTHEIKIVQGSYYSASYTCEGKSLETIPITMSGLWDRDYIEVYVNGKKWTNVGNLYEMYEDSETYFINVGYDNSFNITFGNGVYGKIPDQGTAVEIRYLSHSGTTGNVKYDDISTFRFTDSGYDSFGNSVNLNDYITLSVSNVISGGTDSDTIDFVRNMIGSQSRSGVLATEDNFKLFFKRFSFIGNVNCWSEMNSMTVIAVCTTNIKDYITEYTDYYNMSKSDLILNDNQKEMITNTLNNSNKVFAGVTVKFQDPIIRQYSIICYIKTDDLYNKSTIKENISIAFAKYFMNLDNNTQFIAKSDLITAALDSDSSIKSIDINIISALDESTYKNGYYYKYELKLVNNKFDYVQSKVFYESETHPGLDDYGNISLSSKLEIPMLNGNFNYYPNKDENDKSTSIVMQPIQFLFI